mmetsp:Transcript_18651/g.31346  ORF Transcript_18651/g.31346 Transcript_18651/m.31346 type:complete len:106 (-) Transcript_18651:218-535(-)|eukprot:CAMPEP_0198210116 /NCGR_PEP_ID=MMETSP1445-20131203/19451_1 /TAXON_ID=36898 /ORGANISM="Pyramimonas sp., Strain CCMP2087" /LENGTH=105 /DNA_ID=CAMNT_0043884087 /DNA_START=140 /DNA_END=457 /DNA_ORIENTATION=-
MGKKRVDRNKERAGMDVDGDVSAPVPMDGDLPEAKLAKGSKEGYGEIQGEAANPPRVKQATVRRNIKLRKKVKLEKALNRVEKQSSKQDKEKNKRDMRKALKKMY